MCGRFALGNNTSVDFSDILAGAGSYAGPVSVGAVLPISYNIKPTQSVNIAYIDNGAFHTNAARWWFVPHWHKGDVKGWKATTFNAKIETAHEKPTFRDAWHHGRCLIPASGYFEWTGDKGRKQPWFIGLETNAPVFYFAALRSRHLGGHDTCTILTRAASDQISHLHPRMPVILNSGNALPWLTGDIGTTDAIETLGCDWQGRYKFHTVAPFGQRDDGPDLIERDSFF